MGLPATMRCVEISKPGGPEVLVMGKRPLPSPGPGEVLIKVAAAGVNRADCGQRKGSYPVPAGATDLLGLEVSGTVVGLGAGVESPGLGETVCALCNGGGYAEFAVTAAVLCLPLPKGYEVTHGAALPETYFTVWDGVFMRGALKPGESLLVHGGSSGIGTTAIQLARVFGAGKIFATARNGAKCEAIRALGCGNPINYTDQDFVAVIKKETGNRGVDVVYDMIGGDYFPRNLEALGMDGRHVSVATMHGARAEIDFRQVMGKRLMITGAGLRARSVAQKQIIADALREKVWPLFDSGELRPIIHATLPLSEVAEAHRLMESSQHIGKILLLV